MPLFKKPRNPFKRRLNEESNNVGPLNMKPVPNPFAGTKMKPYHTNVVLQINGHKVGTFPLTLYAYSKSHLEQILAEKSQVIPVNIQAINTNRNGKGKQK